MLYYNGKPWTKSFDTLIETFNIVELPIDDRWKIIKRINRGDNVYTCLNPLCSEIEERNVLMWDINPETLHERSLAMAQEI